jgi:hypothetical protein
MRSLLLMIARVSFSAWVGAAALFVLNGVQLITSPEFSSTQRDQMVLIRFPPYYVFGAVLVGGGWAALAISRNAPGVAGKRWATAMLLVTLSLGLLLYDYFRIYRPLEAILLNAAAVRPAEFVMMHRWSMWINAAHVGLIAIAAPLVSWPGAHNSSD